MRRSSKPEVCNQRLLLCLESEKNYDEHVSMVPHVLLNAEVSLAPRSERVNPPIEFVSKFRSFHE
jgi:hypothetical protein